MKFNLFSLPQIFTHQDQVLLERTVCVLGKGIWKHESNANTLFSGNDNINNFW